MPAFGFAFLRQLARGEMLAELPCNLAEGRLLAAGQRAGSRRSALVEIDDLVGGLPAGRFDDPQRRLFAAERVFGYVRCSLGRIFPTAGRAGLGASLSLRRTGALGRHVA